MGLDAADFDAAMTLDAFRTAWRAFLEGVDRVPTVCAWNQGTLDLLGLALEETPSRACLKNSYRTLSEGNTGSLDEVAERERLAIAPLCMRGRAGVRLGRALAIAEHLHEMTRAQPA